MLPLDGMRVLEIGGGIPAAFATRWLAGFGADVARTEGPEGSLSADEEVALLPGKRRIAAEPPRLRELALAADLLVEDGKPGALAARGLDPLALRAEKPPLVITSLTAFGQTGPQAHWEATNLVAHAAGGILSLTGARDRPPLANGASQAWKLLGLNGFAASVTAWFGALVSGEGDWIDLSAQECAAGMLEYQGPRSAVDGLPAPRLGNRTMAIWGLYRCLDGFAGVCALQRQAQALFEGIGDPELLRPRFLDPLERMKDDRELGEQIERFFADRKKAELLALGLRQKVPFGAVLTPLELLESPSLLERGFFDEVSTLVGVARVPGRPFLGLAWRAGTLSAPAADTDAVLRDWLGGGMGQGVPSEPPQQRPAQRAEGERSRSPVKRLPLEGIRVVDLTMMWAGPYATHVLGEMGAEVIKIESPRAWDNVRTLLPLPGPDPWNASFYFNDYNREKKSLTLDLRQPRGRELFLSLVSRSDAVIENYRADVLDKLGIGWEALHAAKPDLILVSMAGFGKTGADRELVGFGPIVEQMAGLTSLTGYGDDGIPYRTGISYGDPVGGLAAVGALVLALIRRRPTGRGAWIDLAQRETMAQMLGEAFAAASLRGERPVHLGNRHPVWAPQGVYPCKGLAEGLAVRATQASEAAHGSEQWLALSVRSDPEWRALAEAIGAHELAGLPLAERRARHDELDLRIERWTREQDAQAAAEALQARGIPAARMLDSDSVHWDGHLLAREYWDFMPHPRMQPLPQPAPAWRLLEANPRPRRPAPLFGEHNREILCGLLGVLESELAELAAAGVIGDAPIGAGVG